MSSSFDDDLTARRADRNDDVVDRTYDTLDPAEVDRVDPQVDRDLDPMTEEVVEDRLIDPDAEADDVDRPDPSEGVVVDGVSSDPLITVIDGRPEALGMEDTEAEAAANPRRGYDDESTVGEGSMFDRDADGRGPIGEVLDGPDDSRGDGTTYDRDLGDRRGEGSMFDRDADGRGPVGEVLDGPDDASGRPLR